MVTLMRRETAASRRGAAATGEEATHGWKTIQTGREDDGRRGSGRKESVKKESRGGEINPTD